MPASSMVLPPELPDLPADAPQTLMVWRLVWESYGDPAAPLRTNRIIPVFDKARGVKTFNDVGTWQVRFPILDERYDVPNKGDWFLFSTDGVTLESGPATKCTIEYYGKTDALVCTVEGISEESVLRDRIALPDPSRWGQIQTTQSHDARSGLASTVMMGYARAATTNGGPLGTWSRDYGQLQIAPDPLLGPSISMRERYRNILDVIQRAAIKGNLGFRVVRPTGEKPSFEVYQPQDRSNSAVFDIERGNVAEMSWTWTAPTVTTVDAGGQGELTARMMAHDEDNDATRLWRRHIEIFRDQRSEDNLDQLHSDNLAALADGAATELIKLTPTGSSLAKYGEIYELGDLVRARMVTRTGRVLREVVDRVQQIEWEATRTGIRVSPVIGTDGSADLTDATAKALQQRLTQIEGAQ